MRQQSDVKSNALKRTADQRLRMRRIRKKCKIAFNDVILEVNENDRLSLLQKLLKANPDLLEANEIKKLEANEKILAITISLYDANTANKLGNSRIYSDFDGQNSANSVASRAMGGRGVDLNNNISIEKHNGTLLNHDVNSKDNVNSNQFKKGNLLKINKKEKWKEIEKAFIHYWACLLPSQQICGYKKCLLIFNKIRKDMPSVAEFMGIIAYANDTLWCERSDDKIPSAETFFEGEMWRGLLLDVKIKNMLDRNKEHYASVAMKKYNKFLGIQPPTQIQLPSQVQKSPTQAQETQIKSLISTDTKLPTSKEWEMWGEEGGNKMRELANQLGVETMDISEEIERREKLNNGGVL